MSDDLLDDWENPEPDEDDSDASDTSPCPSCGEAIYEDAVRCPFCGDYVSAGSASLFAGRSYWFIVLGILGIVAVIVALVMW